jgi:hypothetical protein
LFLKLLNSIRGTSHFLIKYWQENFIESLDILFIYLFLAIYKGEQSVIRSILLLLLKWQFLFFLNQSNVLSSLIMILKDHTITNKCSKYLREIITWRHSKIILISAWLQSNSVHLLSVENCVSSLMAQRLDISDFIC